MGMEKRVVSVRVSKELYQNLKILAENENRTLSNLIETMLKAYVAEKKELPQNME